MSSARFLCLVFFVALFRVPALMAQSDQGRDPAPAAAAKVAGGSCTEEPREDALPATCIPPTASGDEAAARAVPRPAKIELTIPSGTPLRIALDERVRIGRPGEAVHGRVVETVYTFDQAVIPAGSVVTGHVMKVEEVPGAKRALAYANGNFSPFHKYEVEFDTVTLLDGRQLPIKTTVSPGTAEVVRLVSNPEKEKQKSAAQHATERAKQEAKGKIEEARDRARESWQTLTAPGRLHRIKQFLLAQMPYRRQYLEKGTRFVADLVAPLEFGAAIRSTEELAVVGSAPAPDSTLKARLAAEVSSATAERGTPVTAILTEPLYSPTHLLILPANSRLIGEVVQAKPAHRFHRNGQLRVIFERIETTEETRQALSQLKAQEAQTHSQAMIGNLESVEVDRHASMKLDEEGGAHTTDSKTRYLSTGLAVLLAAAAARPDAEHGTVDPGGDPGVRTAAGGSGFRLTGAVLSFAAKSTPVSIVFGAYGASSSVYTNFLKRGRDVVLPKDTPLEIGFGSPHPASTQHKADKH